MTGRGGNHPVGAFEMTGGGGGHYVGARPEALCSK